MSTPEKIPVIEIYGPVLQGEGSVIGRPTWFVRTGGCDYRCLFCDSMHAVDGAEIDKNKVVMSAAEIAQTAIAKMGWCPMVTLSGGNPLLWELQPFVTALRKAKKIVAVETQATVWKDWIMNCHVITLSPKGPGMLPAGQVESGSKAFFAFMHKLYREVGLGHLEKSVCVKIPVFDSADLEFASGIRKEMDEWGFFGIPLFLSVGNPSVPKPAPQAPDIMPSQEVMTQNLLAKYDKISREVFLYWPLLMRATILPQMHVLQYGNERGR